jgi:microcystin-dependent protein
MPGLQHKDFGYGTINSTIGAGDPRVGMAVNLSSGHGARLPTIDAAQGEFFYVDFINSSGYRERFLCTARSTDQLTLRGAMCGTVARNFAIGDRFEIVISHGHHLDYADLFGLKVVAVGGGTADAITATVKSAIAVLVHGMRLSVLAAHENLTTSPTLTVTFDATSIGGTTVATATKTICKGANVPVSKGDIPAAGYLMDLVYNSTYGKYVLLNPASGVASVPVGCPVPTYSMSDTPDPGYLWADGAAVSRTEYPTLFAKLTLSQTGTLNGTKVITALTDTSKMTVGSEITGTNIAAGSRIRSIDSATQITMTTAATGSGSFTLTFYPHGAGDGSTTFNTPLLTGRSLVGSGAASRIEFFDDADVNTTSNQITVASNTDRWITGMPVLFNVLTGSIGGLSNGATYYVIRVSATLIALASTLANAVAGTAIDITSVGSPSTFKITYTGTDRRVGDVGGEETHANTVAESPAHAHGGNTGTASDGIIQQSGLAFAASGSGVLAALENHTHPITSEGGSGAHNNMAPYAVVRWMVRAS